MHDWLHVVNTISHVQVDNLRAALIESREEVATLQASLTTFESSHDTAAKVLGDAEERVACLEQHRTQQGTELDAARAQRCDLFGMFSLEALPRVHIRRLGMLHHQNGLVVSTCLGKSSKDI